MKMKDIGGFAVSSAMRKKKTSLLVFAVLLLSFAFLVLSLSLSCSVDETNAEYRKSVYGAWYGAIYEGIEEDEAWLREQPWLEELWVAGACGRFTWGGESFTVGSVDEAFFSLSRAKLEEGRMPQAENEIAVSRKVLEALGADDEPGTCLAYA